MHEAQSQHLVQLIHNAAADVGDARIAQTINDIQHYHTDPMEASRIANEAEVKLLVFTHLDPPTSNPLLYWMFYRGVNNNRKGAWISGRDGTLIDLPVGSTRVIVKKVGR